VLGLLPLSHPFFSGLPRPLCLVLAKFSMPPLAKNKSRQKAKCGADEDETMKSQVTGERPAPGFKTFHNGGFPPANSVRFPFISAFPPGVFTPPLFCCCLWHSLAWNANEIGQFDYLAGLCS